MKGFEILFRGEKINLASEFGITIFIYNRNGHYYLDAGSLDKDNISSKWIESDIELGEVLEIEIKDIPNSSEPILIKEAFTDEVRLTEQQIDEMLAEKLEDFYALERYLVKKGAL